MARCNEGLTLSSQHCSARAEQARSFQQVERAERIARSIEMGVASSRGVLLASGQRLVHATPEA